MDSSTAATHTLGADEDDARMTESGRAYNPRYLAVLEHLGMEPRTTHLGAADENGDVEAGHGALKRAIEQHLLLRGSRDFEEYEAYVAFLEAILEGRNRLRHEAVATEMRAMRRLNTAPLSTRREFRPRVSREGTVRVLETPYSVPSGLVGHTVTALVDEWTVEIYFDGHLIQTTERLLGRKRAHIDYRHVVSTLIKKPGGFRNYRYREQMFPTTVFRQAWEDLQTRMPPRRADLNYVRILKLAADTLECDVHHALELFLEEGGLWDADSVEALVRPRSLTDAPHLAPVAVDLAAYDALLSYTEVPHELG
jgi:hypothetical protein